MSDMDDLIKAKTEQQYKLMEAFMSEVFQEYVRARNKFLPARSRHEAYAIALEEFDEVWEEVKKQGRYESYRLEIAQACAMLMAMAIETK
jgi:hypothetical protein